MQVVVNLILFLFFPQARNTPIFKSRKNYNLLIRKFLKIFCIIFFYRNFIDQNRLLMKFNENAFSFLKLLYLRCFF